jgi:hypothetical protein
VRRALFAAAPGEGSVAAAVATAVLAEAVADQAAGGPAVVDEASPSCPLRPTVAG